MELFWKILVGVLFLLSWVIPLPFMVILLIVPTIAALIYFPEQWFLYILLAPWIGLITANIAKELIKKYHKRVK